MRGFGRYEFVLMLLRRMADLQPELVADALRGLDVPRSEQLAAHRRWQELLRSSRFPHDIRRFEIALGGADTVQPLRFGEVVCHAHRWALPVLWPDLAWEVVTDGEGSVLHEWLVRASGAPPSLADFTAMEPWSCVVGDVMAAHPGAAQVDLQLNSRWGVVLAVGGVERLATFVWGLLQTVQRREVDPPDDVSAR